MDKEYFNKCTADFSYEEIIDWLEDAILRYRQTRNLEDLILPCTMLTIKNLCDKAEAIQFFSSAITGLS